MRNAWPQRSEIKEVRSQMSRYMFCVCNDTHSIVCLHLHRNIGNMTQTYKLFCLRESVWSNPTRKFSVCSSTFNGEVKGQVQPETRAWGAGFYFLLIDTLAKQMGVETALTLRFSMLRYERLFHDLYHGSCITEEFSQMPQGIAASHRAVMWLN